MKIWEKISNIQIENPDRFKTIFKETLKNGKDGLFKFKYLEHKEGDYYIIVETDRLNSYFIHIVPEEVYNLFKEISLSEPQQFLGFSILIGKHNGKDVRLSCFGIPCNKLINFLSN